MKVGTLSVTEVNLGYFKLDGGAMFGIVPKTLWQAKAAADTENRISLATRCLLVEGPQFKCLIDSGMGQKWSPKEQGIFALQTPQTVSTLSWRPEDITHVILTHLHFDHAGGMTYRDTSGALARSFPNAEVLVNRHNLETAENPNPRERVSYRAENWELYRQVGQLRLLDSALLQPEEVLPGVSVIRSDGHTRGQQLVLIGGATERPVFFCGDLVPTSAHLPLAWTMGYDIDAVTLMKERKILLEQAVRENWRLVFEHDPLVSLGRAGIVSRRSGGSDFELAEDLSKEFRT